MGAERPLNFRQLEAFRAVMLTGSMTRAGHMLSITQPAVTRLVRDLEHELRLTLFHRNGSQVLPTLEGEQLFREVTRHFDGADRIRLAARAIRESTVGYLHVGAMPNVAGSILPTAIGRLISAFPEMVVSVHPDSSVNLIDKIVHAQLDIAFAVVPADRIGIDHEPFPVTHAVCVMPPGHRLATKQRVTVADLDGEELISLGMQTNAALLNAGVRPRVRVEAVSSPSVIQYVKEGIGIAIIDPIAATCPGAEGLVVRPFRPHIALEFSVLYRERDGRSAPALALARLLKELVPTVSDGALRVAKPDASGG